MGRIIALLIAVAAAVAGWFIGTQVWHSGSLGVASGTFTTHLLWAGLYATISGVVAWIIALNIPLAASIGSGAGK